MQDEAFLSAIEAAPDDVLARSVYADWLEERGDPRADYLRLEERLRATPFDDAERQPLGQRWREARAAQDPTWLRRVEAGAILPHWVPTSARRPSRSGVLDYYEWMRNNHWEWVILAVLAPLEVVARALIESRLRSTPDAAAAAGLWHRHVPLPTPGGVGDEVSPLIPLVQVRGHAWTVALYDTFNLTGPSYSSAHEDAQRLSDRLTTVALEFSSEDTSGATGYHLFECGDLVEFAEWGCFDQWASKKRPLPWERFPESYPDEFFLECGLYVPSFYAREGRDGPSVAIERPGRDEVERADLLALRGAFRGEGTAALLQMRTAFPEVHALSDAPWEEGDNPDSDVPFPDDSIPF